MSFYLWLIHCFNPHTSHISSPLYCAICWNENWFEAQPLIHWLLTYWVCSQVIFILEFLWLQLVNNIILLVIIWFKDRDMFLLFMVVCIRASVCMVWYVQVCAKAQWCILTVFLSNKPHPYFTVTARDLNTASANNLLEWYTSESTILLCRLSYDETKKIYKDLNHI